MLDKNRPRKDKNTGRIYEARIKKYCFLNGIRSEKNEFIWIIYVNPWKKGK